MRRVCVFLTTIAVFMTACEDPQSTNDETTAPTVTDSLEITLPAGLVHYNYRVVGPSYPLGGTIHVERGSRDVTTAVVTVNNVTIPHTISGVYEITDDVNQQLSVGPGQTVTIAATDSGQTARLVLTFPQDVALTSPSDGSMVGAGQTITVSWTGSLGPYDWTQFDGPQLVLSGNSRNEDGLNHPMSLGIPTSGANWVGLEADDVSAELTLPQTSEPGYLLTLIVPGDAIGTSRCVLNRGVYLVKE